MAETRPDRVTVKFTCRACGLVDAEAGVRHRAEGEDIASWMVTVRRVVGFAHTLRSPGCRAKVVDLKIPLVEGKMIGEGDHENPPP